MAGPGRKRLFTDEQLIELHKKGLSDRAMGEKLGAETKTVGVHRRRLRLKPHNPIRLFTDEQLIELNEQGFNDREIAEKLGAADTKTVNGHRRRLGLKSHGSRLRIADEQGRRRLFTDEYLIELHEQGLNDRAMGEKLGFAKTTMRARRVRLGLESQWDIWYNLEISKR